MKQVVLYDNTSGAYWRENSCGYTSSKYEAGIFEEEEAKRIIKSNKERQFTINDVPANHPAIAQKTIDDLQCCLNHALGAIAVYTRLLNTIYVPPEPPQTS